MKPTTLTLWDQFTHHEAARMTELKGPFSVVMGVRLKVNASYDNKLETKGSTIFNFNPPLPQANVLKTWCLAHSTEIQNLDVGHLNQIRTPATFVESPSERQIIKINCLPRIVSECYWIRPVCKITDINQNFFYMSCSKCNHGTDATDDTPFWCNFCDQKVKPMPRCKFNVMLSDSTGNITATTFTKIAETMFGITAQYLKENTPEV
ncbi:hypothetical protein RHGRI_026864 [Rhododendron griersonianum]|uniref:Replication factor A C-terminal domain-containing protein n=1 Tax=Rhododendron griersonianum TaxID=479676 RepID=A0AAV6IVH9_9ERIC|nr:hypothetical protein RHGRI_026864 [Rhododendron griersonianum]